MFIQTSVKRAHELETQDILLWEGHYYAVWSVERYAPAFTRVELTSQEFGLPDLTKTLHSDLNVMLYTWNK